MMPAYEIALFVHLLALLAATAASAIIKLAGSRRAAARTLREALAWGGLIGKTSRVFPIAVLTLVATGSYMSASRWGWRTGWIEAGFVGAFLLLASGAFLGRRGAMAAREAVTRLQSANYEPPNDAPPDVVAAVVSEANTGLALAIACVMTVKPGLAVSLAILVVGALAGASLAISHVRARMPESDTSEFESA